MRTHTHTHVTSMHTIDTQVTDCMTFNIALNTPDDPGSIITSIYIAMAYNN